MAYPRATKLQLRKQVTRLRAQVYYWRKRKQRLDRREKELKHQEALIKEEVDRRVAHFPPPAEEARQRIAYLEHKLAGYMRDYAPLHAIRDQVADLALASRQAGMPFSYHDALVAFDTALRKRPLHDHES